MGAAGSVSRMSSRVDIKDLKSESKSQKKSTIDSQKKTAPDVMISYSHADTDFMKKFKTQLEAHGIHVWVDVTGLKAGVDFLEKIGQAIIDAKMFIQLLSESSITSKYCQDELALAYISNKPIFPVSLQQPDELFPKMDTGMKLQLARFNWNMFTDEGRFDKNMEELVKKLKTFKDTGKMETSLDREKPVRQGNSRTKVNNYKTPFGAKMDEMIGAIESSGSSSFWETHFAKETSVPWERFAGVFTKQYEKSLEKLFAASDRDWLEYILKRELVSEENPDVVMKESYTEFCTVEEEVRSFWERVQEQALESYTMKEVFDMNSSVRVEAIDNLGKFRSKAVVEALKDLLHDKDNNIRAVAAISLAKTRETSPDVIREVMQCLSDSDRLVREAACLALGHMKAAQAVKKILHLWRNDTISSVREAAQVALELIGGTEANKAMYITKVLSDEIHMLTQE